jgi:polar amino acid transport system permease protein
MASYTWDFSIIMHYKQALLTGLGVTIGITVAAIILGTIIGITIAIMKMSKNKAVHHSAAAFIEIFRDLPLLVLLVWFFYMIPVMIGVNISATMTAIIALSLNLGAFAAEIFRGGFKSVHKGQIEAAKALGLTKMQTIRHVIFPQALQVVMPALTGRYIETIKLTSLASVIAVNELLHSGQNLISVSFRPLEVYTVIAILYLAIIIPLSISLQRMEAKNVRA